MGSTWIWRGNYDRMERVDTTGQLNRSAGERAGKPLSAQGWTAVKEGDAVIVWNDSRPFDESRFKPIWVLNAKAAQAARM
ncbi:hypothetical protein AB4Z21_02865, partial [Paenibacillus sp. MCAF20]